jgi:DNA-binding transcriptional ArsR family regulator
MKHQPHAVDVAPTGDSLLKVLAALANPQRMRILATLAGGRMYVSSLARELRLSRPLVHLHLSRLEGAGLVTGSLELSADGKAMKWFEVVPFTLRLSPQQLAEAVESLTIEHPPAEPARGNDAAQRKITGGKPSDG